ncbi:hypothetical protein EsH8_III_001001 [Colletotrichum jinshuiense]
MMIPVFAHLMTVVNFITGPTADQGVPANSQDTEVQLRSPSPRSYFTPILPPVMHPLKCNDEKDFPGHADVDILRQYEGVFDFCQHEVAQQTFTKLDDVLLSPGREARRIFEDPGGVKHEFKVFWEGGCKIMATKQEIQRPLGEDGPSCAKIMRWNFENCTNGGVGGSVKIGCLIWTYNGGI